MTTPTDPYLAEPKSYAGCLNAPLTMHSSNAETLAVKALGYLASEGDALLRFLEASGLTPDDLRARACDPELLAAVMDFLLSDDVLAGRFAAAESVDSALLHAARRTLPGGIADQGS